ncbi:MAG: efflux RND transporter periplasmic adaptor subunit [Thermoguttaceae bacterium]
MKTIAGKDTQDSHVSTGATPAPPGEVVARVTNDTSAATANPPPHSEPPATPKDGSHHATELQPSVTTPPVRRYRKWLLLAGVAAGLAVAGYLLVPWVNTALNTISTEDAYVNGNATFVAPRVSGQVMKVLVNDNNRVKKGDLLAQLDKEPYQVQVALKRTAVRAAEATLAAAESKARGLEAQLGAQRWKLQNASEQVDVQIGLLRSQVAALRSQEAILNRAQADFNRAAALLPQAAISHQEYDRYDQQLRVAVASVAQAHEAIAQTRVSLGLAPQPEKGKELTDVPPDLNQTFSAVRMGVADCMQTMTQLGLPLGSIDLTPNKALEEFHRLDKKGNFEQIAKDLVPKVPFVLQAKVALEEARHDLELAELNLRYCDITSEIDGVVTGKNVNPGNNVQAGQALMAVRSLTEIWIDANFKETQLGDLRIGQRVRCEVDMYGSRREFEGRITGFTMGTGQTLSLLPAQNATGNYVKIVQRLPVRVELTDYDPAKTPLFVGLSVTPYVYYKEPPTGPHAGEMMQPLAVLPSGATDPQTQAPGTTRSPTENGPRSTDHE